MAIGSFFKQRKPRQFDHKPIYYDQKKDELQKRIDRIKQEVEESESNQEALKDLENLSEEDIQRLKEGIKGSFLSGTHHLKKHYEGGIGNSQRGSRIIKSLLLIVGLLFISWVLFFYFK